MPARLSPVPARNSRLMNESKSPPVGSLAWAGPGLLIGGAEIIPGVSARTVALVLGIYQRLMAAVSRFRLRSYP